MAEVKNPEKDDEGDVIPVMDSRRIRMMMSQYKEFHNRKSPYVICIPDHKNMNKWYALICGLDKPHEFGEYWIVFKAGPEFPQKAPKNFRVLTENGVFEMGGPICLSMGEFHDRDGGGRKDIWRPSLGMVGFAENVANAMICHSSLEGGLRIKPYPTEIKGIKKFDSAVARVAQNSSKFNFAHSPQLVSHLNKFIQEFPNNPAVKGLLAGRAKAAGADKAVSLKTPPQAATSAGKSAAASAAASAATSAGKRQTPNPNLSAHGTAECSLDDYIDDLLCTSDGAE